MAELPQVSGREVIKALERVGFQEVNVEGSHHQMKKSGIRWVITVPCHGSRPLGKGLLKKILRLADLTVEQFQELL